MSYKSFQKEIIKKHGEFFTSQIEVFFTKAVDLANNEKYDEALEVGNDALILSKYSTVDYEILYLIGMLCQAYLQNDQPKIANKFFKYGMTIADELNETYERDINSFLDLKIEIDKALKRKK